MSVDRDRRGNPAPGGPARKPGSPRPGASRVAKKALRRGPAFERPRLVLGPLNYGLMGAGVLSILVGFSLLAARDISLAPFLLVLGFCVLIPAGLLVERVPGRKPGASEAPTEGE
jgi:hypothetical protein